MKERESTQNGWILEKFIKLNGICLLVFWGGKATIFNDANNGENYNYIKNMDGFHGIFANFGRRGS